MSDPTPDTGEAMAETREIVSRQSHLRTARQLVAARAEVVSLRARLAATEIQRDTAWREADALRADVDALTAMVECCRELVPELSSPAQDELAEIVGWPLARAAAIPPEDLDG
jgi:hypothetical protein